MRETEESVLELHSTDVNRGLNVTAVSSLRRIHGLNKLEGEVKVTNVITSKIYHFFATFLLI